MTRLLSFRWMQEKENTERWAEETKSRLCKARSGSLRRFKSVSSLNVYLASSLASSCPPSRVPSTPRMRRRSPARKIQRLGVMPLVCVCVLPAASLPQHTGFLFFFVCCFFLFLPRRKSGIFAILRGLRYLKPPSR